MTGRWPMWKNFGGFGSGQPGQRRNPIIWIVVIAAILIYSQYDGSLFGNIDQSHISRMTVPPEEVTGAFALIDHTGAPRTERDFHGTHTLIHFGYTWCPDVCPSAMLVMAQVLEDLAARGRSVRPLFITVDPARDTVEKLAAYVDLLIPGLVGLTGSEEAVAQALDSFGMERRSHRTGDDDTDYLVDHTSLFYLMAPDGAFVQHFDPSQGPTRIAVDIERYLPDRTEG